MGLEPIGLVAAADDVRAVPSFPAFDGWRVPLWTQKEWELRSLGGAAEGGISEAQLRYLAAFGVLAPTSHNTIPQRFKLLPEEGALLVFIDRELVLPESDPTGRQASISIGCVLTNIEIAAGVFGRATEVELFEGSASDLARSSATVSSSRARYVPIAKLRFPSCAAPLASDWLRALTEHKVVRAEYDAAIELPPELVQAAHRIVQQVAPTTEGLQAHVLTGALALRALGKFQEQADRFVLENRLFAEELGRWLLPNSDHREPRAMRGIEFGFDDEFAEQVHRGLLGERRLLPDQIAAFAKGGKVGLESSSAVLVFTADADELPQRVAAGRACHRISLEMQRAGFASAYHAALTEVEWVARMFSATVLRSLRRPLALLRVGRPRRALDAERPQAARPALDALLLSGNAG
jgi:hypothetical protein